MTNSAVVPWPPFPLGRPTNRAWREFALTRAAEMRALLEWFKAMPGGKVTIDPAEVHALDRAIEWHLDEAIYAAKRKPRWYRPSGAKRKPRWYRPSNRVINARVGGHLDAAETALLRRAPADYLGGQIDHVLAHIQFHLPQGDPRREGVEKLVTIVQSGGSIDDRMRESIVRAVSIASLQSRRESNNVQSFTNIIWWTTTVLFIGTVFIGLWGVISPQDLSLCFHPDPQNPDDAVCPAGDDETSRDIFLIEAIGVLAASISGALTLRHISGKSGRFGLPVALAVLKLPIGALSAVLGLILVRGEFIPGLSHLDSSEQIVAWAVIFGASQQFITGLVDRQASNVIGELGSQTNKKLE